MAESLYDDLYENGPWRERAELALCLLLASSIAAVKGDPF